MDLYARKNVYRSTEEEKAIREYLDRQLTLEEEWQRYFNVERKRLYNAIHPEWKTREIEPYPKPKDDPLRPVKGESCIGLNLVRMQRTLPEPFYLLEFGSTWRMSSVETSDRDLLYIGDEADFPKEQARSLLGGYDFQHHGALTATKEMLSYWPLDLIPPFMLQAAFDHGEHHKLALWGTWYHREAVEEFIRSVMYWRTWRDREGPKDDYETALLCAMWAMFPCIYQSAKKHPKPKAVAALLMGTPFTALASHVWTMRESGHRRADLNLKGGNELMEKVADKLMVEAVQCAFWL
ncbi:MAG: hypothetical protein QME66_10385 [Candidatus Eisenbacteria bacterium]|nr:hypothetical protein [Candidatus Eisenbacteria bacterium]